MYIWIYVLIALIAVVGLIVNIKTIALNDVTQKTTRHLDALKEENEGLWLRVLSFTTLENIEHISVQKLGMIPCRTVVYLPSGGHAAK